MKVAYRLITGLIAILTSAAVASAAGHAPIFAQLQAPATNESAAPVEGEKKQEVLIRADKMTYDANTNVVTAEGNIEVTYGERTLIADKLSY
ncbi:MAG: LptA/OstA family protein, partial [Micropepsaceae bacterium]